MCLIKDEGNVRGAIYRQNNETVDNEILYSA